MIPDNSSDLAVLRPYGVRCDAEYSTEFRGKFLSISPIKGRRFLNTFVDDLVVGRLRKKSQSVMLK